jgi:hypothetical protein
MFSTLSETNLIFLIPVSLNFVFVERLFGRIESGTFDAKLPDAGQLVRVLPVRVVVIVLKEEKRKINLKKEKQFYF